MEEVDRNGRESLEVELLQVEWEGLLAVYRGWGLLLEVERKGREWSSFSVPGVLFVGDVWNG